MARGNLKTTTKSVDWQRPTESGRSLRKSSPLGRLEAHLHDDRCREGRTAVERDIREGFLDAQHPQYPKNVDTFRLVTIS